MDFSDKNKNMGRPRFKPTKSMRNQVEIAVAAGLSETETAHVIGIARSTLLAHFADELRFGRARKLLFVLDLLERSARARSVAAMKYLCTVYSQQGTVRLSKKEQRRRDAAEALRNSPWADLIGRVDEPEARNGQ
jgi:hypothetical protein